MSLGIFTTSFIIATVTFCRGETEQIVSADCGITINEKITRFTKNIIRDIRFTKYQHEPEVIDRENGKYITNCSGFANFVLLSVYPEAYQVLEIEKSWPLKGKPRPRAAAYYKAFIDSELESHESHRYWQRIYKIMDSKPGDFLAWENDNFDGKGNTGHVLIIIGEPLLLEDGTVSIEVVDASRHPHSNDTREVFTGGGLGKGIMRFKIDSHGKPEGIHWTLKKSKTKLRKIAIGRLK